MLPRKINADGSFIADDDTADSLPAERCRICLKEGEMPIFGDSDLSKNVVMFGDIEISPDDNLPQHLCDSCHGLLEAAVLFRETAKQTDEILRNANTYEGSSVWSADNDNINIESLNDTDNDTIIKKEYLDYNDTSDEENDWEMQTLSEPEHCNYETEDNIEDVSLENEDGVESDEEDSNKDAESEMVMLIVSDKDKPRLSSTAHELEKPARKNKENVSNTASEQLQCEICSQLVDEDEYDSHISQHREKYKYSKVKRNSKVECEICNKKVTKTYYNYHIKMHGNEKEQAERLVRCTGCNKYFSSRYINDHIKRKHQKKKPDKTINSIAKQTKTEKQKKCPVCDKDVNESVYKEHLVKHGALKKKFICDQCGKEFKYSSAFKTHILTHGSELKFQCQFCPYRGLHQGLLKIHVRTHTGDYNYKCTECPAKFITKSNLSKHIARHKGTYKFKCEECGKGFYGKRDLTKHVQVVHKGIRDSICDICGKAFGHRDIMVNHQLKVHKREKITEKQGRMPNYLREELLKKNTK